jgi:hypothetical protein
MYFALEFLLKVEYRAYAAGFEQFIENMEKSIQSYSNRLKN